MLICYKRGQGSIILRVKIRNSSVSTGAGLTGLTNASSGLIISTIADNEASATTYTAGGSTIETITTLGTYAAPTATKCRFKEVDATNHKGVYEIQLADARYAVSSAKSLLVSIVGATNAAECDAVIPLVDWNPYSAALDTNAITEAAFAADTAKYQARMDLRDDNGGTADRYVAVWHKNSTAIFTGITSPTIQVIKVADGTDLIAETAMTQIGTSGMYRYVESTNRIVNGVGYIAIFKATIESATRTVAVPFGRDS